MATRAPLIPPHGGYRHLKSFQVAEVIYDATVRFCARYVDRRSRTRDQMVQAARSGRQNIAEGSMDSATSKKLELKLTGVAKGSLEELRLDYEDFLRQRGLPKWAWNDPRRTELIARRPATADAVAQWVRDVRNGHHGQNGPEPASMMSMASTSPSYPEIAANGILALITVAVSLLDRQIQALAAAFEKEGGFTERLHRVRTASRRATSSTGRDSC